jgi:NADH:ubiquinone oxidoreductase subunit H
MNESAMGLSIIALLMMTGIEFREISEQQAGMNWKCVLPTLSFIIF